MRKDKTGDRKEKPPRSHFKFSIGPNSSPRKVQRWLGRGGGSPLARSIMAITIDHVHPRHVR